VSFSFFFSINPFLLKGNLKQRLLKGSATKIKVQLSDGRNSLAGPIGNNLTG
jgi:hypothetical protein